jgi:hypothetical protein
MGAMTLRGILRVNELFPRVGCSQGIAVAYGEVMDEVIAWREAVGSALITTVTASAGGRRG